jgi:hypothetical protein
LPFGLAVPNEAATFVLDYLRVRIEQVVFEVFQGFVAQSKLPFEHAVGESATLLQERHNLTADFI